MRFLRAAVAVLCASLPALADGSSPAVAGLDRPLVNGAGRLSIDGAGLGINLSAGSVGQPLTVPFSVSYGVDDKLTLGVNDSAIFSPFRGGALLESQGLCLNGTSNGCAHFLQATQLGARYGFGAGAVSLAAIGGISLGGFDPFELSLYGGVQGAWKVAGKVVILFQPQLQLGLANRDGGNREVLSIPVEVGFQATPQLFGFVQTGFSSILNPVTGGFGDFINVPLGVGALFNVDGHLDVGGAFTFTNLFVSTAGPDLRQLTAFVNYRQ